VSENRNVPAPVAAGNEDTRTAPNQGMTHRRVYHQRRYIDVDGTRVMWCGARWKYTLPPTGNAVPCPLCALAVAVAHEGLAA
jgi:hypothetical protein